MYWARASRPLPLVRKAFSLHFIEQKTCVCLFAKNHRPQRLHSRIRASIPADARCQTAHPNMLTVKSAVVWFFVEAKGRDSLVPFAERPMAEEASKPPLGLSGNSPDTSQAENSLITAYFVAISPTQAGRVFHSMVDFVFLHRVAPGWQPPPPGVRGMNAGLRHLGIPHTLDQQ